MYCVPQRIFLHFGVSIPIWVPEYMVTLVLTI